MVSGEILLRKSIHVRLTVERGEESGKVLIAGSRFVQNHQMVKSKNRLQGGTCDGFDANFLGFGVSPGGSVKSHVIDEGDGLVSQLSGATYQVLGRGGTAEEGEIGFGEEFHLKVK